MCTVQHYYLYDISRLLHSTEFGFLFVSLAHFLEELNGETKQKKQNQARKLE